MTSTERVRTPIELPRTPPAAHDTPHHHQANPQVTDLRHDFAGSLGFVGSSGQNAVLEYRAGADEVGCVHGAPAGLCCFDELKAIAMPTALERGPLVTRWRSWAIANVDSVGFVCGGGPSARRGSRRTPAGRRGRR